jgi:hypothetical protein
VKKWNKSKNLFQTSYLLLKITASLRTNFATVAHPAEGKFFACCWKLAEEALHMTRRNSELIL